MTALEQIKSLNERIERVERNGSILLSEGKRMIKEDRMLASSNELFDLLDSMETSGGKFVTIGYLVGANLNIPQVKRKNPDTNRMKNYDDYESFSKQIGEENEIGGIISVTSFQVNWKPRSKFGEFYNKYKQDLDAIRAEYGLEPTGSRDSTETQSDYGNGAISTYSGANSELSSNSYAPMQNVATSKKKRTYYVVDKDGHISHPIEKEKLAAFFKPSREPSGVAALRKLGVEEAKIQEYIKRVQDLKVVINKFENSKILYISTTIDGQEYTFINDRLTTNINGVTIAPEDFYRIAKERYEKDVPALNEPVQ